MSFFGIGRDKTANIVRVDHKNNVESSDDFKSVSKANHVLSTHLASTGAVVIRKELNEFDGIEATALERIAGSRTWG